MYWPDTNTVVDVEPARKPVASALRKYFTEGGPGVPPTVPGGDWFNQVTNEILNVLEAAGIDPSKTDDDQLLQAIQTIITTGFTIDGVLTDNPVFAPVPAYAEDPANAQPQVLANRTLAILRLHASKAARDIGYTLAAGSFEKGGTLTSALQVLLQETTGDIWSWQGALNKTVPPDSSPASTGGVSDTAWRRRTDDALLGRQFANSINPNVTPMIFAAPVVISYAGILQTGQSLAEGGKGNDSTPTMRPLNRACRQLVGGPVGIAAEVLGSRTKILHERGVRGTTGSTIADVVVSSGVARSACFHGQAEGGKTYAELGKGGITGVYEKCITQVASVFFENSAAEYIGVNCIHGEADGLINNPNYEANLGQWIADFNVDIKAITGQSRDIPMFISQTSSACGYGEVGGISNMDFQSPLQQLSAHVNNPLITLVQPKYQYAYVDESHITNLAQAFLGEKDGQAMAWQRRMGTKWQPLRPISFEWSGSDLFIKFTGSVLEEDDQGLSFETNAIVPVLNYGFQYLDDAGRTITSVTIIDKNTVRISLSNLPGANPIIAYAYKNGVAGGVSQVAGTGERGQLRDNDKTTSKIDGRRLFNYCVTFRKEL